MPQGHPEGKPINGGHGLQPWQEAEMNRQQDEAIRARLEREKNAKKVELFDPTSTKRDNDGGNEVH